MGHHIDQTVHPVHVLSFDILLNAKDGTAARDSMREFSLHPIDGGALQNREKRREIKKGREKEFEMELRALLLRSLILTM